MKTHLIGLFLALLPATTALAQTSTISGSNGEWLNIGNVGTTDPYPSDIHIAGGEPYTVGLRVEFPYFYMDGNLNDLDILLESPGGKLVMLMSDYAENSASVQQVGFSSYATRELGATGMQYSTFYRPMNFGTTPDTFPDPGPGIIAPGGASFIPLINENPNGTWRLWIVSDDEGQWSYFSLDHGWSLSIETSPVPVCLQPEPAQVLAKTDTTALVVWQGNGPAARWDLFWQADYLDAPNADTAPLVSDWANDSFLIQNLSPGEGYDLYVRSVCPDSRRSLWTGPVAFSTLFTPCLYAHPLALCQTVSCDTVSAVLGFPVQSACGTGDPHWIFRFTAAETGAYWIQYYGFDAGAFSVAYLLPDTASNCPQTGWKCVPQSPSGPFNRILDTLIAGKSYFLFLQTDFVEPVFRLSRCPSTGVTIIQSGQEPFSASVSFPGLPNNSPGIFDLFYTRDSTVVPGYDTAPTEAGIAVPLNSPNYHLAADTLTPSSTYHIWLREPCEAGAAVPCWEGPFSFTTGTYCGAFDSVWFDQVSDKSARLNFLAPSNGFFEYQLWLAPHAQYLNFPTTQFYADSAGRLIQREIQGLDPDTEYEIYLQAFCWPSGNDNPWQGPFIFKTKPGCFLDLRDISCGELVTGTSFKYNKFSRFESDACFGNNWEFHSVNEALFRITAEKTGELEVYGNLVGGSNISHWYYKDAALGCNGNGFISAGCCAGLQNSVTVPVDSGRTYYLMVDALLWQGQSQDSLNFIVYGCAPPCPQVDSIWLDAKTATSATLRWRNVAPGSTYQISYRPEVADSVQIASTTDSTITLSGLVPSELYRFTIKTYCPGGEPRVGDTYLFQLGDHLVVRESAFSRCNPRFVLPGDTVSVNYDVVELRVPVEGDYRLISKYENMLVYDHPFDPENAADHLIAGAVIPPFNNRADTLLHLLPATTYSWVLCNSRNYPVTSSFNMSYNYLTLLVDGPAEAQLGEARWNGREPQAHGQVPLQISAWHSGTCRDTSGWVHYYKIADDPNDPNNDALLLSLKTGVDANVLNSLPLVFYGSPGAALVTNPPALFVQNPDGWYEMNRFWLMQDLGPDQQIDSVFTVRFYYTETDFEKMRAAIELAGGALDTHEAMYFHKINGYHHFDYINPAYSHPNIPAAAAYDSVGYWTYANGPEASTTTWRHGTFAGEHYAEMVIRGFSGGGGGASVNGKGVFDPVSKTTDAAAGKAIALSPNPNSGQFNVELPQPADPGLLLRITDGTGRSLLELAVEVGSTIQSVDAGLLPAGLYFLQVVSEGKTVAAGKWVKQ